MHDEPIPPPAGTPLEADTETQGAVLAHLLIAAPAHLTLDELLRELADDEDQSRGLTIKAKKGRETVWVPVRGARNRVLATLENPNHEESVLQGFPAAT